MSDNTIFFTIFIGVGAIICIPVILWFLSTEAEDRLRRSRNFDWFRSVHSECIRGSQISCPHCRGTRIHVRSLMQQTFMREHFCTTCGKTLYYSPEATT
jgi:hypothetical protein